MQQATPTPNTILVINPQAVECCHSSPPHLAGELDKVFIVGTRHLHGHNMATVCRRYRPSMTITVEVAGLQEQKAVNIISVTAR